MESETENSTPQVWDRHEGLLLQQTEYSGKNRTDRRSDTPQKNNGDNKLEETEHRHRETKEQGNLNVGEQFA